MTKASASMSKGDTGPQEHISLPTTLVSGANNGRIAMSRRAGDRMGGAVSAAGTVLAGACGCVPIGDHPADMFD